MKNKGMFLIAIILATLLSQTVFSTTFKPSLVTGSELNIDAASTKNLAAIGPFDLSSSDGNSKIKLQFAGQLWLQYESLDKGKSADRATNFYMKPRRVRLTMSGSIVKPELTYRLHLSMAPKSLELMDFYAEYALAKSLSFRFGQFKVPFTQYRIQSFQRLTFVDWAIVTKYFGAERQMGFAVHNGFEKPPKWGFVAGIYTGVNARASHAVGLPIVYGEELENPSDLVNPASSAKFHPELFLHTTLNTNDINLQSDSDGERKGFRTSTALSLAYDLDPRPFYDFRLRVSPEFLCKFSGWSIHLVGYAGFSDINGAENMTHAMSGGLVQTALRINEKFEVSARYAIVDFEKKLIDEAYDRAQELIEDSEDDPDITAQYKNAGKTLREHELTLGLNIYIMGQSLKWQNDISLLQHNLRTESRKDYGARSQFQITF